MQGNIYDVIIVGGGMAGAHAAYPLVQAGKRVLMLDGGVMSEIKAHDTQGKNFEELRASDTLQHELFLGAQLDAISAAARKSHAAAMTSGNRAHVAARTGELLPLQEHGTHLLQSLARGGLSEAWGGVCAVFSERELTGAGLPADMRSEYQAVMDIAGISGSEDSYNTHPPAHLARSARLLLGRYDSLDEGVRGEFRMRQPLLALLTEKKEGRETTQYKDLDYYVDDRSIYRARYTIEEMERKENFAYKSGYIVRSVGTKNGMRQIVARDFSGRTEVFHASRVILAAGALNTTRIMLQSDPSIQSATLFVKPNHILACLDVRSLGLKDESERHSLCQLTVDLPDRQGGSALFAHLYAYKSLLLWRLKERVPLPAPEALALLSLYAPSLMLVDARLPGSEGICEASLENNALAVRRGEETFRYKQMLRQLKKDLRKLGLFALHTAHPPLGASAHYAGGVEAEPDGMVRGQEGVYVADSSTWKALPAKPPALTIMANARRIGNEVLRSF